VFQLHVPVQPVNHGNGSITAGGLEIATAPSSQVDLIDMQSFNTSQVEFEKGWRVDISNPNGCGFDVTLTAP
jgi:hypothetical protein